MNNRGDIRAVNLMIASLILIFLFIVFFLIIKLIALDKAEKITAQIQKQTIATELTTFLQTKINQKNIADILVEEDLETFVQELNKTFQTNKCHIEINGQKKRTNCNNPSNPKIKTSIILPTKDKQTKQIYLEIE